jgi:hypothetical protein
VFRLLGCWCSSLTHVWHTGLHRQDVIQHHYLPWACVICG